MKLALTLLLASFSLSPSWMPSVAQDKQDRPATGKDQPRRASPWGTEEEAQRLREGLIGAWRLTSAKRNTAVYEGEFCEGYMLVTPEHLSMQARILAPSGAARGMFNEGFSAGTYRWKFDVARQSLVIQTTMAVSNFESGEVVWEDAGAQREYQVVLTEDLLTLTRPGEAEFNYLRSRPTPPPKAKPTPEKK
jgi:hypothetical protein